MNALVSQFGRRTVAGCLFVTFWCTCAPCLPGQEAADDPFEAPNVAEGNVVEKPVGNPIEIVVRIEGANLETLPLAQDKIQLLTEGLVVTTRSGKRARIEVIREEIHPVEVDASGAPVKFDVENLGFSLVVEAAVQNNGVACRLEAILVELGEKDGESVLYSFLKSTAKHQGIIAADRPLRLKLRTKSGDLVTVVVSAREVR